MLVPTPPYEICGLDEDLPIKEVRRSLLISIADSNPIRALELSRMWPDMGLTKLARKWAAEDPVEMIRAVAKTNDPEVQRVMTLVGLEWMASKHTGSEMIGLAMELPAHLREPALTMTAYHWWKSAPAEAEAWGMRVEDPVARRKFLWALYDGRSQSAPEETAASLAGIPDLILRDRIAAKVAESWARQNPPAAAGWAASLPEGLSSETLAIAHRSAAYKWTEKSPVDSLAWFSSLPNSPAKQAAADGVATALKKMHSIDEINSLVEANSEMSESDRSLIMSRVPAEPKVEN